MSKAKKLFKKLSKTPMTYGQMQGFVFKLSDDGTYPRKYLTKKNGHPQGYWGTNFAQFKGNRLLVKGEDKLYRLTELGKLNTDKPFANFRNLKQNKKTIAERKEQDFDFYKNGYNKYSEDYSVLWDKNWNTKQELEKVSDYKEVLLEENQALKRKLSRYEREEEIDFLQSLDGDDRECSTIQRIINKIKGKE